MASSRAGVRALLALVALVGVAVGGCDLTVSRARSAGTPRPTTTTSTTTTSTTVTTTTPVSRPLQATTAGGVVDLAQQPCAALDQNQAAALGAQGAGEEIDGSDGPACRWSTAAAVFGFFPEPDEDLTTNQATQNRSSPTRIGGHDARTGIQGADGANCIVTVSAGNGQSFEVLLAPSGANPRGHALCAGLGVNVAAAVLTHLP